MPERGRSAVIAANNAYADHDDVSQGRLYELSAGRTATSSAVGPQIAHPQPGRETRTAGARLLSGPYKPAENALAPPQRHPKEAIWHTRIKGRIHHVCKRCFGLAASDWSGAGSPPERTTHRPQDLTAKIA